jgi:hypothetical protein
MKAKRYNENKLRMDLIPPEADKAMAEILTFGAEKYGDRNWELGFPYLSLLASAKRHILAWEMGENNDVESGFNHMKHALTNIAMLVHHIERFPDNDNRINNIRSQRITTSERQTQLATIVSLVALNLFPKELRKGQYLYAAACKLFPNEVNELKGTDADCFSNDDRIDTFINELLNKLK